MISCEMIWDDFVWNDLKWFVVEWFEMISCEMICGEMFGWFWTVHRIGTSNCSGWWWILAAAYVTYIESMSVYCKLCYIWWE